MNADELRPILAGYRLQVETAWSEDTAVYKGTAGSPRGQCGVTSAWLQERLLEDHDIDTLFCHGVLCSNHAVIDYDHCWLEHIDGRFIVLDLTADQFPGLPQVVCGTYSWNLILIYIAQVSRTPSELAADEPLQRRLALLKKAL